MRAAVVPAAPHFDVIGHGCSDMLYRAIKTTSTSARRVTATTTRATWRLDDLDEKCKDIITPGDLNHDGSPEILTLSASGTLSLRSGQDPTGASYPYWNGTGCQRYNKVVSAGDLNGGRDRRRLRPYARL